MDQSEIDALLAVNKDKAKPEKKGKKAKSKTKPKAKSKSATKSKEPEKDLVEIAKNDPNAVHRDKDAHVVSELEDSVTQVTEQEATKVLDHMDVILSQVNSLDGFFDTILSQLGNQVTDEVGKEFEHAKELSNRIRDSIYSAMDLMQFQDVTRQKLERVAYHLRQLHEYVVDLLGVSSSADELSVRNMRIGRSISQTGTTPDENRDYADSVINEFQNKVDKKK